MQVMPRFAAKQLYPFPETARTVTTANSLRIRAALGNIISDVSKLFTVLVIDTHDHFDMFLPSPTF